MCQLLLCLVASKAFRSTCPSSISIVLFYMLHIADWAINFKYWDNRCTEVWLLWTQENSPVSLCMVVVVVLQSDAALASIAVVIVHFQHQFHFLAYLNIISRSYTVIEKRLYTFQTFLLNFLKLFSTSVVFIDFLHVPAGLLRCLYIRELCSRKWQKELQLRRNIRREY